MTFSIDVKIRNEKAEIVRSQGLVPGVMYGPEAKPVSFAAESSIFNKLYEGAGESNLVNLTLDGGKPVIVLVQDVQRDPVKNTITHVDLLQINMNKEMHATVPVHFVGESAAVKALGGTLIKALEEVEVKCLPKDLVGSIDVDLSVLTTFNDVVHIKDLILPAGLTVTENPEIVVVKVAAPLTEEELKALEESNLGDVTAVEVAGEKKEDEEVVEGAEVKSEEPKKE